MRSSLALALLPLSLLRAVAAWSDVEKWSIEGVNGARIEHAGFNPDAPDSLGPTAQRPTDNVGWSHADYNSLEVACGGLSAGEGVETWDVEAGKNIIAHWYGWIKDFRGPAMQYMAECPNGSCDGVDAVGLEWFKISQRSYTDRWATTFVYEKGGWTFKIPKSVKPGRVSEQVGTRLETDRYSAYLVRHELMSLASQFEPRVWPVCIQVNVFSSANGVPEPSETTTFPAAFYTPAGWDKFDFYNDILSNFRIPGPPVAKFVHV